RCCLPSVPSRLCPTLPSGWTLPRCCSSSRRSWATPSTTPSAGPSGPGAFRAESPRLFKKNHFLPRRRFTEENAGPPTLLARFMPIIRTFAPFVAGIGKMSYPRFALFNVVGGIGWILLFLVGGWWFGGRAIVQHNFKLVILAIIVISVLPAGF